MHSFTIIMQPLRLAASKRKTVSYSSRDWELKLELMTMCLLLRAVSSFASGHVEGHLLTSSSKSLPYILCKCHLSDQAELGPMLMTSCKLYYLWEDI